MRRAFVSCSRPIRFDEKSVNRGLPVLDQARALEPCHRPEGSWALGTRMLETLTNQLVLSISVILNGKLLLGINLIKGVSF